MWSCSGRCICKRPLVLLVASLRGRLTRSRLCQRRLTTLWPASTSAAIVLMLRCFSKERGERQIILSHQLQLHGIRLGVWLARSADVALRIGAATAVVRHLISVSSDCFC